MSSENHFQVSSWVAQRESERAREKGNINKFALFVYTNCSQAASDFVASENVGSERKKLHPRAALVARQEDLDVYIRAN